MANERLLDIEDRLTAYRAVPETQDPDAVEAFLVNAGDDMEYLLDLVRIQQNHLLTLRDENARLKVWDDD